ncbi:hypothetical protein [Sebaldella sp. S0638]|uniref:hypothetical protein n=1 Tax=Sebaldella sp. S0638 TaxID=2957809 RepID=UPI0020A06A94|nr:hypothetical protein [Sebaldella sp. S0638]MCP1223512.1 hypothetical protein [Sebaldella sp. S0638]
MVKDGIVFLDKNEKIIFNQYSFCEYIKWNMVKFADKTYEEAGKIVNKSNLTGKVERITEVYCLIHEVPYHWAMLLIYGDMYWLNGIPYPEPCKNEEYTAWENEISEKYNLKEICEFYSE